MSGRASVGVADKGAEPLILWDKALQVTPRTAVNQTMQGEWGRKSQTIPAGELKPQGKKLV